MKMKNLFLGWSFLAIAGLWTGCSNEQVIDGSGLSGQREIAFRLQGSMPETRATGTTIDYVDAFVVYGTDDVIEDAGGPPSTMLFNGVTVARIAEAPGGAGAFDYNPKRYYSADAEYAGFFAYSPVSKYFKYDMISNGIGVACDFYYTVVAPDGLAGETTQEDLLVATDFKNGNTNPPLSTNVTLHFQHALARVFVTATNTTASPVIIKSLSLNNLKSKALFRIVHVGDPTPWTWMNWTIPAAYPYALAASGIAVPAGADKALVTSMEQGMMVLPQETVFTTPENLANDFYLEVGYDHANLTGQSKKIRLDDGIAPAGYTFEAGKQYRINITFSGNAIDFTVDVELFDADFKDA